MLALVVADGDEVGVVEEDIGGHEDRVGEEADPGRLFATFGRLVLELGHAVQLTHAGGALEQPGQLGVLVDMALDEQGATRRVSPQASKKVAIVSVALESSSGSPGTVRACRSTTQ